MESPHKRSSGLIRLWNALLYSIDGLKAAYTGEQAFRQEVWLAALLIPTVFLLPVSGVGRALMLGSILLVLIIELLNSAIEAAIDRIGLEKHPLSKRAKDIGSASVFIALINVIVIWGCVLIA